MTQPLSKETCLHQWANTNQLKSPYQCGLFSKWLSCGFFSSESAPYLRLWKCAFSVLPAHVYPTLPLLATSNYLQINFLFRWASLPTVWIWTKLSLRPQFLQQPLPSHRHRQAPFGEHCLWVSGHQTFQHQVFYREPHTLLPASCLLSATVSESGCRLSGAETVRRDPHFCLVGLTLLESPIMLSVLCWDLNSPELAPCHFWQRQ